MAEAADSRVRNLRARVIVALCAGLFVVGVRHAAPQGVRFIRSQLTWFDRTGKKIRVVGALADYGNVELSPDGTRLAVGVMNDVERGTRDIWIVDVATGQHVVFAAESADENWAVWSRDGKRLVFNSGRNGGLDLYQAPAQENGVAMAEPLLIDRDAKWPVSWSADGRYVLYVISGQRPGNHIQVLPLVGDRKPFSYQRSGDTEFWAAFGPDGKWVLYSSTESGQAEVYVSAFPPPANGRKYLVSRGGGTQGRWRRDGKEIYFLSTDRTIVAVPVNEKGNDFEVGVPQTLFEVRFPYGQYHAFDVAADGQRFLVDTLVTTPGASAVAH